MTDKEAKTFTDTLKKFSLTVEESSRFIRVLSKPKHLYMKSSPKLYGQSLLK